VPADDALPQDSCAYGARLAMPPRVVIDTNVWLDLFVFQDRAVLPLAQALQSAALVAIRSCQTDAELLVVLARPRFARLAGASSSALMQHWLALAQCTTTLGSAPWLCRDPNDQKFLDLAYSARAHNLITRDRALLRLAPAARPTGLRIVGPAAFGAAPDNWPVQNQGCFIAADRFSNRTTGA